MLGAARQAVLEGDIDQVRTLTDSAIPTGPTAREILDSSLTALDVVGQEHEEGQRYVPEMLISAEAMKASLLKLKPL